MPRAGHTFVILVTPLVKEGMLNWYRVQRPNTVYTRHFTLPQLRDNYAQARPTQGLKGCVSVKGIEECVERCGCLWQPCCIVLHPPVGFPDCLL